MTISVTPLESGTSAFHVVLYASNHTRIWSQYISEALSEKTDLVAGNYYLLVESSNRASGQYAVGVDSAVCAHSWSAWKVTKAATVFKAGTKQRACSLCGLTQKKTISNLKPVIKLSKTKLTVRVGRSSSAVKLTKYAKGDYIKSVTANNKKIVTAKKSGKYGIKITGKKSGMTTVTVKLASGKSAKFKVTVKR